jgi:hypothetical protein
MLPQDLPTIPDDYTGAPNKPTRVEHTQAGPSTAPEGDAMTMILQEIQKLQANQQVNPQFADYKEEEYLEKEEELDWDYEDPGEQGLLPYNEYNDTADPHLLFTARRAV